jgi:quercetin dioxygenase-like cupin family protein
MDKKDFVNTLDAGNLYLLNTNEIIGKKTWNAHLKFRGVYLKDIITGSQTDGAFSAHLVKIESGCSIGEHIHEGKAELHEIISGSGTCTIGSKEVSYLPGDCALIPHDILHKVIAGKDGLFLLAKFVPALL